MGIFYIVLFMLNVYYHTQQKYFDFQYRISLSNKHPNYDIHLTFVISEYIIFFIFSIYFISIANRMRIYHRLYEEHTEKCTENNDN